MDAERWGRVVGEIMGKGPGALAAKWEACCAATASAHQLAPFPECNPDNWTEQKHRDVEGLRKFSDIDAVRSSAQMCPVDFGVWRNHCLDLEAKNAARLQVLCWVLKTLYSMRHDQELVGVASAMADKIGNTLERYWHLKPDEVSNIPHVDYREWCTRKTRNYRMLPKLWRYV